MQKHTLTFFMLMVICLGVCSCSSLKKFGQQKKFLYKEITVDNNGKIYDNFSDILYVDNSKVNCFDDPLNGDVITVSADALNKALNYFYKGKAVWDIKETKTAHRRETIMQATNPAQVQYEVAYCSFRFLGVIDEVYVYASFRLVAP